MVRVGRALDLDVGSASPVRARSEAARIDRAPPRPARRRRPPGGGAGQWSRGAAASGDGVRDGGHGSGWAASRSHGQAAGPVVTARTAIRRCQCPRARGVSVGYAPSVVLDLGTGPCVNITASVRGCRRCSSPIEAVIHPRRMPPSSGTVHMHTPTSSLQERSAGLAARVARRPSLSQRPPWSRQAASAAGPVNDGNDWPDGGPKSTASVKETRRPSRARAIVRRRSPAAAAPVTSMSFLTMTRYLSKSLRDAHGSRSTRLLRATDFNKTPFTNGSLLPRRTHYSGALGRTPGRATVRKISGANGGVQVCEEGPSPPRRDRQPTPTRDRHAPTPPPRQRHAESVSQPTPSRRSPATRRRRSPRLRRRRSPRPRRPSLRNPGTGRDRDLQDRQQGHAVIR